MNLSCTYRLSETTRKQIAQIRAWLDEGTGLQHTATDVVTYAIAQVAARVDANNPSNKSGKKKGKSDKVY